MVRFSSNVKRPKAVVKQNQPVISKEAPPTIQIPKQKQPRNRVNSYYGHAHSRSLPSNPHQISFIQEIGLSSGQAIKKLIEEIDRILLKHKSAKKTLKAFDIIPLLRYSSILLLAIVSLWKRENLSFGLFCSFILCCEIFFIEIIEAKRGSTVVSNSIREIRNNLRKLDKLLLSGTIQPNSLYSLVNIT